MEASFSGGGKGLSTVLSPFHRGLGHPWKYHNESYSEHLIIAIAASNYHVKSSFSIAIATKLPSILETQL